MSNTGNYCSGMLPEFNRDCCGDNLRAAQPYREGRPIDIEASLEETARRFREMYGDPRPINFESNIPAPSDWLRALENAERDFRRMAGNVTFPIGGPTFRPGPEVLSDCKEVKLLKKLRQLFKFQVERQGCFENGLCAFVDNLATEEKLTRKEVDLFIKLVQKNPTKFMEESSYLFPAGKVQPRMVWLNILIDKYSIKAKYKVAKGIRNHLEMLEEQSGTIADPRDNKPCTLYKVQNRNLFIEFYGLCAFVQTLQDLGIFDEFECHTAKEVIEELMKRYRNNRDTRYMFEPGDIDSRLSVLNLYIKEAESKLDKLDLKIKYLSDDSQKA